MLMRSLGVDWCSGIGDPGELRIWATVVYSYQLIAIQLPKVDLCAAFCVDHAIRFIPVRKSSLSPETLWSICFVSGPELPPLVDGIFLTFMLVPAPSQHIFRMCGWRCHDIICIAHLGISGDFDPIAQHFSVSRHFHSSICLCNNWLLCLCLANQINGFLCMLIVFCFSEILAFFVVGSKNWIVQAWR